MNVDPPSEDLADIEAALRRLKPRAPSAICVAQIAAKLDAPAEDARAARVPPAGRVLRWVVPLLAAAACAAFLLIPGNLALLTQHATPTLVENTVVASDNANAGVTAAPAAAVAPDSETAPEIEADDVPVATIHVAASASEPILSELRSAEPLAIRRTPDGRAYQPYRIRYKNTVSVPAGRGRAPTMLRVVPSEEVHFVHLENPHAAAPAGKPKGESRIAQNEDSAPRLTQTEVRRIRQRISNQAAVKVAAPAHQCPHHAGERAATVPTATITVFDGDSTVRLTCKGACRCLNVTNAAGKIVFSGPVETPEDRQSIPPEIARKLHIVEQLSPQFPRPEVPRTESAAAPEKPAGSAPAAPVPAPVRIRV